MPPLAVMLVAGVGMDALISTLFFLAGVIPGHIHGFYVTWTYFSRKKKVRKGRYPGGPKPLLYSKRVTNGDASDERVRRLWREEQSAREDKLLRKGSSATATRRSTMFGRRSTRDANGYAHSRGSRSAGC